MNIILLEEHEIGHALSRWDDRTKHLIKVLRKKAGDEFEAGILGGLCGTGRIEKINFDGSIFVTVNADRPPPTRYRLRTAAAFARPIQMRRIFRDLSCIGVAYIDIFSTDMSEKSYRDTKLLTDGGARSALIEGAVQARDTLIPPITEYKSLEEWLNIRPWDNKDNTRTPILLAMDNVRPEGSIFNMALTSRPAVIAIGPERGWSDRERQLFEDAGFSLLSMGMRPLRTETACIAAAMLAAGKTESEYL